MVYILTGFKSLPPHQTCAFKGYASPSVSVKGHIYLKNKVTLLRRYIKIHTIHPVTIHSFSKRFLGVYWCAWHCWVTGLKEEDGIYQKDSNQNGARRMRASERTLPGHYEGKTQ